MGPVRSWQDRAPRRIRHLSLFAGRFRLPLGSEQPIQHHCGGKEHCPIEYKFRSRRSSSFGKQSLSERNSTRRENATAWRPGLSRSNNRSLPTRRSAWVTWDRMDITSCFPLDANEPIPTICPASPCPASLANGTIYYPTNAPFANPALANSTTWFTEGLSSYNALELDVTKPLQPRVSTSRSVHLLQEPGRRHRRE